MLIFILHSIPHGRRVLRRLFFVSIAWLAHLRSFSWLLWCYFGWLSIDFCLLGCVVSISSQLSRFFFCILHSFIQSTSARPSPVRLGRATDPFVSIGIELKQTGMNDPFVSIGSWNERVVCSFVSIANWNERATDPKRVGLGRFAGRQIDVLCWCRLSLPNKSNRNPNPSAPKR